ncbi:hypothetical protein ABT215_04075 [Streptomyces sp900105755]|uniref:hypothetical protein n=1 Tax=Streptomyces sp. 900105755 TaxID=3154389 RepID=UPI003318516D
MKVRADVAAMLRAGATYREIHTQLKVSNATIASTREALDIPHARLPTRGPTDAERVAHTLRQHPRVAELLREGATHSKITAETGVRSDAITRVRRALGIPVPKGRRLGAAAQNRTVAEVLAHYTEHLADGHAHWTGSFNGRRPVLWRHQRPLQARRETFRAHHGRDPEGRVRVDCDDPACIAGAHLTDNPIRAAREAGTTPADGLDLDALYDAIFTTGDTP